jgi:hypothetical protein
MDRFGFFWELSVAGVAGADFSGGPALAGIAIHAGPQLSITIGDDELFQYSMLQSLFGNAWGGGLALTTLGSTRGPTIFAAGVQLTFTHALVFDDWRGRLRVPSLWGLATPEVGLATRPGFDPAVYVAWSAPFAVLVSDGLGLELTPRAFVIYGAHPQTIGLVSLGLVQRPTRRQINDELEVRDEGRTIVPVRDRTAR